MAPIDFYYMPESPPCRAVEMVAGMAGVVLNKRYINLAKREHLNEDYVKLNPIHRVPFIVDGDLKMSESRAILKYLVDKYAPGNDLYPSDLQKRALVDELLFYEIGTLYAAASKLLKPKLFGAVKVLNAEDEKVFKDCLQYLDERLAGNGNQKFMLGNHVTIADVSLAASFTFPAACDYDISGYKNLVAYLDRLKSTIPNYAEINDKAVDNMTKFIRSKQEA